MSWAIIELIPKKIAEIASKNIYKPSVGKTIKNFKIPYHFQLENKADNMGFF